MDVVSARRLVARRRVCLLLAACAIRPGAAGAQEAEIRIGGTGAALGTLKLMAQAHAVGGNGTRIGVQPSLGSSGSIKALLGGALHIAVSSRELTPAEASAGAVAVEYARTPFVLATAATNPVGGLTLQELVDAYAGHRTTWADGSRLRLVLRPASDADSKMLKAMSPAMREAVTLAEQRKGQLVAATDQEAAASIETLPGALGTTTLALILSENRALKALALDGVMPTPQAAALGAYAWYRSLYLVTGPATTAQAQAFVAFVRSPAGAEILLRTGHWLP